MQKLRRGNTTQVASSVPFDNNGTNFDSSNAQDAIEESLLTSISLPRFPINLVMNGTMSNGDWVTYSNLVPASSVIIPAKCELREITWSNTRTSVEFDLEFYKNGRTTTKYVTRSVSSGAESSGQFLSLSDPFDATDTIDIKYIDQGTNASDLVIVLFFQTVL